MGASSFHPASSPAWDLSSAQGDVISHAQLIELGFSRGSIKHRIAKGRLYPIWPGIYAMGTISRRGVWNAALLACGPEAVLSHGSAAALWQIGDEGPLIEVSVPKRVLRRGDGLIVHRRGDFTAADVTERDGIRVTSVVRTLVDLATRLPRNELEEAINSADVGRLIDPEALRSALPPLKGWPGAGKLRKTLDRRTFRVTRSRLERRLLLLVGAVGLPLPETRVYVNAFEVDFYWPDLRLVVETDGLTYHRTPAQQAEDRRLDQVHTAAGLTCLRFTHGQVFFEPAYVRDTLAAVALRGQTTRE
jgi:very-short-patch-repair endonuclease